MSHNPKTEIKPIEKPQPDPLDKERRITLIAVPDSNDFEFQRKNVDDDSIQTVRFPKSYKDRLQMVPDDFVEAQNAIEELEQEQVKVAIHANSLESCIGYDSLLRVMNKYYGNRVAYYRSEEGGALSREQAMREVYRQNITDEQAEELIDEVMRLPVEQVHFYHLLELISKSPRTAQNIWEMIKRAAQNDFESGHRAAEVFEPADFMTDAWNQASYLGIRESLIEEWQPKGGIELTMIDTIAQTWLQFQFWTKESVKRTHTRPREESHEFYQWKQQVRLACPKQWQNGQWDLPFVHEQEAVEHAARMADRWQKMYLRAIRSLRDWRRYTPQVTINNPQQVNIAGDGGQ